MFLETVDNARCLKRKTSSRRSGDLRSYVQGELLLLLLVWVLLLLSMYKDMQIYLNI